MGGLVDDIAHMTKLGVHQRLQITTAEHVIQIPKYHHPCFQLRSGCGADAPTGPGVNHRRGVLDQPLVRQPQRSSTGTTEGVPAASWGLHCSAASRKLASGFSIGGLRALVWLGEALGSDRAALG
ncbi:hypothetical protein Aglo01_31470 [Actinokineospora globicatena]|nr:hypothetical protein Aglo01_31470 [Actinokineospora globicatena]GLW84667.1 hypothetical protein Aglo02_23070 [Actinokineospora globicatena]